MQKIFMLAFALALVFTSCSNNANSPKAALKAAVEDVDKNGIKNLGNHCCKSDKDALDKFMTVNNMVKSLVGIDPSELLKTKLGDKILKPSNIEYKEEKIDGNGATVAVLLKDKNETQNIKMVKEDNKWKLCYELKDLISGAIKDKIPTDKVLNELNDLLK
jgi:PBP1b-binding outer membrane lipoprotein LpoB